MHGIGAAELLVTAVAGLVCFALPIAAIVLVVVLLQRRGSDGPSDSYSQLVDENRRLREEIAALKAKNTLP